MIKDQRPRQIGSSIHSTDDDPLVEQESPVFEYVRRKSTAGGGRQMQAIKPTHQRFVFADPVALRYAPKYPIWVCW